MILVDSSYGENNFQAVTAGQELSEEAMAYLRGLPIISGSGSYIGTFKCVRAIEPDFVVAVLRQRNVSGNWRITDTTWVHCYRRGEVKEVGFSTEDFDVNRRRGPQMIERPERKVTGLGEVVIDGDTVTVELLNQGYPTRTHTFDFSAQAEEEVK